MVEMKKAMRIVFVNHGTAGEWGGGDSVQIKKTAEKLIQRGHEVIIQNKDRPDIKTADLVHIFNCRVFPSFKEQIATCQAAENQLWFSNLDKYWKSPMG